MPAKTQTIAFMPSPAYAPPASKLSWMAWAGIALGVGAVGLVVWKLSR